MPWKVQSLLSCSFNIAIHAQCHANQFLFTQYFASVTEKKNAKKKIAYVKSFIFPKTEQQLK
jgi:hypothetical protein